MRGGPLDADDSFASNRPSTATYGGAGCLHPPSIFDLAYKQSAIRRVNAYLSAHNFLISLSLKSLPSARDVTETLKFILLRLEFQSSAKFEDDLPVLLKLLNCPHKLNRSALKAPGTPHAFPHILAVIHWLVQIAEFKDHLSLSATEATAEADESGSLYAEVDPITAHVLKCYSHFMQGDDDAAEALKSEFRMKMEREKNALKENVKSLDRYIVDLESKLEGLRSGPSQLEAMKLVKEDLEKDRLKLTDFIAKLTDGMEIMQKALKEKERELAEAVDEKGKIFDENDELRRKVEKQEIDYWAADRMRREMQSMERDIKEAESARVEWEDKCWSLGEKTNQQVDALEDLTIESNQALRRLKLGSDLQYTLNTKGSTVLEVMGIDSKSTIKPAINSLTQEIKGSSMTNSEELLAVQLQTVRIRDKTEAKKKRIAELQGSIEDKEALLDSIEMEIQGKESMYKAEAENMLKAVEAEAHNLDIKDREAKEALRAAELKLAETEKRSQDEIQMCAYELFAVIDAVSKHKEYMESKLQDMSKGLSETADSMSNVLTRSRHHNQSACLPATRINLCP